MATPDTNGWSKAELFVKETLERHTKQIDTIEVQVSKIHARLTGLGVKIAALIGLVALVASAVATAIARSWGG